MTIFLQLCTFRSRLVDIQGTRFHPGIFADARAEGDPDFGREVTASAHIDEAGNSEQMWKTASGSIYGDKMIVYPPVDIKRPE
jgi:hypothetical protein